MLHILQDTFRFGQGVKVLELSGFYEFTGDSGIAVSGNHNNFSDLGSSIGIMLGIFYQVSLTIRRRNCFPVHCCKLSFTTDMTLGDRETTESDDITTESIEPSATGSRLISKVLAPAVRLWLRSQVEQVEALSVEITAGDRQLLSGYIQQITLSAKHAIYQGLALNQIQLTGQNIRVNAGQIVRGKPLRLLEPIRISGSVLLEEADLNASLKAPLLKAGVTEFLMALLRSGAGISSDRDLNLQNLTIQLRSQQVVLGATLVSDSGNETPIAIRTGFDLAAPNLLRLVNPQWLPHATAKRGLPLSDLDGYTFNLGDETEIHELAIDPEKVTCQGKLIVLPA